MSLLVAILLSTAHLLCMQLASAGPLLCVWLDIRAVRSGDSCWDAWGQRLGGFSLASLFAGGGLGVALGWWLARTAGRDYGGVVYQLGARMWWGVWELLFYVLVMLVYLSWWRDRRSQSRWQRIFHRLLAVIAATNLLYHFPTLWSVAGRLWEQPLEAAAVIDSAAYRSLLGQTEVLAKSAHFWVASLATAGMTTLAMSAFSRDTHCAEGVGMSGARIALAAVLTQMPTGMWLLTAVPPTEQRRLLGGSVLLTATLVAGVTIALALAQQLAQLSFGEFSRRRAQFSAVLYLLVIGTMTATLVLQNHWGR